MRQCRVESCVWLCRRRAGVSPIIRFSSLPGDDPKTTDKPWYGDDLIWGMYSFLDVNSDGSVKIQGVKVADDNMELKAAFTGLDHDGNGDVSKQEFVVGAGGGTGLEEFL